MKTKLVFFFAIALIAACKNSQAPKATPTAPPIALSVEYPMLDSADIFNQGKVATWQPSGDAIVYARKVYLNAVDRYANQKDAKGSLPLFLRALRIDPEPLIFLHYGQALLLDTQYNAAYLAATAALRDSTIAPDANMLSARCLAYFASEYQEYLIAALASGKFDIREVAAYDEFKDYANNESFKITLAKYDFTNEQRRHALLDLFRINFKQEELPFEIGPDSLRVESNQEIDYMFDDLIPELGGVTAAFNRNPMQTFQYVAALPSGSGFHTLVYRSVNYVAMITDSMDLPPYTYYLMTIDTAGQNIDKIDLACACSPLNIKTAAIDTTGLIAVQSIHQTYKYNPIDSGYEHNEVIRREPTGTKYYRINSKGKIEEQDKATAHAD